MAVIYFAQWILLPSGEILHNGGLAVEGSRIVSIGQRGRIKRAPEDRIVNLGDLCLLPGLINMHIHLEEGVVRSNPKEPEETFAAWLAKKNSRIRNAAPDIVRASIRLGARELLSHGITTVVDSSRLGLSADVLTKEPIRACVVHETHPEDPLQEETAVGLIKKRVASMQGICFSGAGPYALFSLSPANHRLLIDTATKNKWLWITHLAESAEELQAFSEQKGDLYFHITRKKGWAYGKAPMGPMRYALENDLIAPGAACVHCNYVNGGELDRLLSKNAFIVQCFQYTSALGHKPFPLDSARSRGIKLCLGTESIVYSESMDLFDELNFAKRLYPHVPAAEMLRWVTQNPADALGAGDKLGSLAEGKLADIIGVRIRHDGGEDLLEQLIVGESDVRLVIVNGEEVIANY
jgi:cytosine/adenosine deaminase-related metal-dependent hydrolase